MPTEDASLSPSGSPEESPAPEERGEGWPELLEYLHRVRGLDFRGYKPSSLVRRMRKRMAALGIGSYPAYRDYLEVHPDEFPPLFDTLLINVTGFFRDPEAWEVIRTAVIPQILAAKREREPIRVWSAGCASGEEAYTLAILFVEALGVEEYRGRVKIYATDADEAALAAARRAAYTQRQVQAVPAALLDAYFERLDGLYVFRKDLRRQLIFGRHDLVNDAPISRIDLLVCRNTLMYFNAETQAKILSRLGFALNQGGFLFLGRAETAMAHGQALTPVDLKRRILRKAAGARRRRGIPERLPVAGDLDQPGGQTGLRDVALDAGPTAHLVVDTRGRVAFINGQARTLLGLRPGDLGRPVQDLQLSYPPGELRSLIEQAGKERRAVILREIEWAAAGASDPCWLDLQVVPLLDATGAPLGVGVTFVDVTGRRRLRRELKRSHQELEAAPFLLASGLRSLRTGVAVVDRDLRILVWNDRAEELWGLRADEVVGRQLPALDIGLPVERLAPVLRPCPNGANDGQPFSLEIVDRRGRGIHCEVTCAPLLGPEEDVRGAVVFMEAGGG